MTYNVEDVFVTEGVPEFTFVRPPNYGEILVDVRRVGKPVIIEGQSGTGKTTCVRQVLAEIGQAEQASYLSPRKLADSATIHAVAEGAAVGRYVIDDFHRLDEAIKEAIANIAKLAAEDPENQSLPKLIIIGINQVGSDLIQLVPDIAKRIGVHRIQAGTANEIRSIIASGSERLNMVFINPEAVVEEVRGDYWLTQQVCRTMCGIEGIYRTLEESREVEFDIPAVRTQVVERLSNSYRNAVKEFSRGRRFRPTNDPYFKLLRLVGQQENSNVDLTMLANAHADVRGSINNIKDKRLSVLLEAKPICGQFFYYDAETKNFAIDDPALFYYIRHLNWDAMRHECGFREGVRDYNYDLAISFAGENRDLAELIAAQLDALDIRVFYDRYYEANFLGRAWGEQFERIFKDESRMVLALLDEHHRQKIWPTFERDCFAPRVEEGAVIPVFLDKTIFPGIPKDIAAIHFKHAEGADLPAAVTTQIVYPVIDRLDGMEQ